MYEIDCWQPLLTNHSFTSDIYESAGPDAGTSMFLAVPNGTIEDEVQGHETVNYNDHSIEMARNLVRTILVPVICVFGIVGNCLTLFLLTRKRLKSTCDGTERTVNIGLMALAASDLLCCVSLLPHGLFKSVKFMYPSLSFQLIYRTYGDALINTFILTSTWLTVTMATSRYLAICHPFRARYIVGLTGTRVSIAVVFLLCLLANIPRFFEYYIDYIKCHDGSYRLMRNHGFTKVNERVYFIYMWVYFSIGIVIPLTVLAFCNICLVRALRESSRLRRRYRVPAAHVDSNYRITSILVTIVVMYIVLVSPAEIIRFVDQQYEGEKDQNTFSAKSIIHEATNVLQTINFACNFALYFALNIHFRKALKDVLYNCWGKKKNCNTASGTNDSTRVTRMSRNREPPSCPNSQSQPLNSTCSVNKHMDQTIL